MIWLAPAALCSITIAFILKVNEGRGGSRILIAGANYIVASAISFALLAARGGDAATGPGGINGLFGRPGAATLALGLAGGVVYVLGFLLLMAAIARLPLAVPVTVARLSVALPVVAAIVLWSEEPNAAQWVGIALGLVAILLFGASLSSAGRVSLAGGRSALLVVSVFVVLGLGDVILKAFREAARETDRLVFTCVLFGAAAVFTWLLVPLRRVRFDARTFGLGLVLGVPNLFSTIFTLLALRTVAASIAFPVINLTVIAGSTLLGFAVWKERLRALGAAGLVTAAVALLFLTVR